MKTKTKRLQALFLALAMSVGVLQASVSAAEVIITDPQNPSVPGHINHRLDFYWYDDITITADGNYTADIYCKDCDESFTLTGKADVLSKTDASCTNPAMVTYVANVLGYEKKETFTTANALGHNYEYKFSWPKIDCLYKGTNIVGDVTVQATCQRCGKVEKAVPATSVVEDRSKRVNPTFPCKPGSATLIAAYTVDGKTVATDSKEYPYLEKPVSHTWGEYKIENEVEATCTKGGSWDRVARCTVCNEILHSVPYKTGKTGHTAGVAKKENVVAATTKKGGSYDLVVRCTDCGKVLSKTHKTTAKIVVNASKVNSVKNYKGKKAKVYLKKASSISGYQIQYATNKSYKSAKYVNTKATSKYLTKLSKNKKYYVRVRTYKVISGKVYYSSWSGSKTVTIKK